MQSNTNLIPNDSFSAKQLGIILLCLSFNVVDGFDITAMAIAVKHIGEEFQIAANQLGWLFSAALAGMMLGAMSLAPISDLIGRRKVTIIALLVIGITVLCTGLTNNFTLIMLLRFCSGLGAGALLACQAALASEYAPEKYRALAVTVVTSGYPIGAILTGVIAQFVIPEYGWRGLFIGGGCFTLFMLLVALFFIPESLQFLVEKQPKQALKKINKILVSLKQTTLEQLPEKVVTEKSDSLLHNTKSLWSSEFQQRTFILWTVFFLCFMTLYFLLSWIPKLITNSGFSDQTAYTAFSLFNVGGVVGIYVLGWLSARMHLTKLVVGFLFISGLLMLLYSQLPAQEFLLLSVITLIGFSQQGGFVGLYAIAAKVYPTQIRSTGVGWAIGLGRFGAVVGPAIAGYTIALGISAANNFALFALPMIVASVIAFKLSTK